MRIFLRMFHFLPDKFSALFVLKRMHLGITIAQNTMSGLEHAIHTVMPGCSACNPIGGALKRERSK
jgi:hypothetical protein